MFRQRVKHDHQCLCSCIHLKTKFSQSPTDSVRLQRPSKQPALKSCIQSLLSKNAIERVENVKSLGCYSRLFLAPKVEASNRPKQAQRLPTCRKVQNGNTRIHQGFSDSRGMGVVDRPMRRLPSHPPPPKLREVPQVFQFTSLPFGLATAPHVFTMIVKEVKVMALSRGIRLHYYLEDWLIKQSQNYVFHSNPQHLNLHTWF